MLPVMDTEVLLNLGIYLYLSVIAFIFVRIIQSIFI